MRVALDVSAVPVRPAGAGRYIVEVASRLAAPELALTVVTRRDDADRWRDISPGATVAPQVPAGRVTRLAYERVRLGVTFVARANDVWHSPHYTMPHRRRGPVVVTVHDTTFFTHPAYHERAKVAVFTRAIAYAVREASVILAVSEYTATQLMDRFPGARPILVAPHGVDLERFSPTETAGGDARTPRYVLFVGTLEPRKGIDVLLSAFAALARHDDDLELRLVGQTGWGVGDLPAQILSHPAAGRISQLGYLSDDDLVAQLRGASVVVYPSRGEGFGLPVLEAMACGAAVVTTADTVMAEVGGAAVTLVPAGDAEALAHAVTGVLARTALERDAAARAARERASAFSWERSVAAHRAAYAAALAQG